MTNISSLYYERALSSINQVSNYTQTTDKTSKSTFSQTSGDSFGPAFNISIGQSSNAVTGVLAYDSSGRGGMSLSSEQKEVIDEVFAKYLGESDERPSKETMDKIKEELEANGIEMSAPPPPPQDAGGMSELTDEEKAIVDEIFAKYLGESGEEPSEETLQKIGEELEANGISLKAPPKGPPPSGGSSPSSSVEDDDEEDETSNIVTLLSSTEEEDEKSILLELLEKFKEDQEKNISSSALDFLSGLI